MSVAQQCCDVQACAISRQRAGGRGSRQPARAECTEACRSRLVPFLSHSAACTWQTFVSACPMLWGQWCPRGERLLVVHSAPQVHGLAGSRRTCSCPWLLICQGGANTPALVARDTAGLQDLGPALESSVVVMRVSAADRSLVPERTLSALMPGILEALELSGKWAATVPICAARVVCCSAGRLWHDRPLLLTAAAVQGTGVHRRLPSAPWAAMPPWSAATSGSSCAA